jgi:hypothetical protein
MRFATIAATVLLLASVDAAAQWTNCARENGLCMFEGRKEVAYGNGNRWVSKVYTGGVKCSNDKFGDPAPGVPKTCRYRDIASTHSAQITPRWVRCAAEGQICKVSGTRTVAFGADKRFKYRVSKNAVSCTSDIFGDPAVGKVKACYVEPD